MTGRRQLLGAAVFGAAFGLAGTKATRAGASIRFIGRRSTIIALLDTGSERILFVMGEKDDELLANISGLTTVGSTRIDLMVATHGILASRSARTHLGIDATQTLAMQADMSLPPIRGRVTPVPEAIALELGDSTSIQLIPATLNSDHPDFVVDIKSHGVRIVLASSNEAIRLANSGNSELLAIPGRSDAITSSRTVPQLLVCNTTSPGSEFRTQMQVYPSDPQVVRIERDGISVRDDQLSS